MVRIIGLLPFFGLSKRLAQMESNSSSIQKADSKSMYNSLKFEIAGVAVSSSLR